MEWQAVVLAVQILLLAAGWILFQRARGELSVRAAETPVLAEIRALQKNVKQLLGEIEAAADRQAQRLEMGQSNATAALADIEETILDAERRLESYEQRIAALDRILTSAAENAEALAPPSYRRDPVSHAVVASSSSERALSEAPAGLKSAVASADGVAGGETNSREIVYRLADSGEPISSIARATRLSEGEIETLLNLRGQRK